MGRRFAFAVLAMSAFAVIVAGSASAAQPTAITGPVQGVGGSSATVTGTVNPGGQATTWTFDYGTSTSYGQQVASSSAGSGTSNLDVASSLAGLTPGTTYHYRVVAQNASGTARGADGTFTTLKAPAVTTGAAGGVSSDAATISAKVDPNGLSTSWQIEYGTSTAYGSQTSAKDAGSGDGSVDVSAQLTGLKSKTTYHYRVVATSSAGTTRGSDRSFTTAGGRVPGVSGVSAKGIGQTSATLNGRVDPNGLATTWYFEIGSTTAYGTKISPRSAGSGDGNVSVSFALSGLTPATTYHFRLVAQNSVGTTVGGDVRFTAVAAITATTGTTSKVGATTATVNGTVGPGGRSTQYWFEYGTTAAYGSRTSTGNAGSGSSSVSVARDLTGLQSGTTYHYRLVAKSSAGTITGKDATFTTVATAVIGPLRVVEIRPTSASVVVSVDTKNRSTTVVLQYGDSPSRLDRRAGPVSLDSGVRDASFELIGLPSGRRVFMQAVATSSLGTTQGSVGSFATPALPTSAAGKRISCTIVGTQGPDRLRGTSGRDVICGLGGDDRINGLDGNDVVVGGPGNDVIVGGDGNDVLVGGDGMDQLVGGAGADHLEGGAGADKLFGGPGADTLLGGSGGDTLLGGSGRDVMLGGSGDDVILGHDGMRDVIDGGSGRNSGTTDTGRDRVVRVRR